MRIEFDPTNRDEATAVRAVLDAMYGPPASWPSEFEDGQKYRAEENEALAKMDGQEQTDSTGTPWDERIHSNPPTQNKDGTWRAKRGVKPELVEQVRAEREALEANLTAKDAELIEQAEPQEIAPVEEPAPKAPTPPAPPAPQWTGDIVPEPERSVASYSFLDVMKAITAAQKDGKIDTAKVKEMCAAVDAGDSTMGLNGPDNADKRAAFMALLGEVTG